MGLMLLKDLMMSYFQYYVGLSASCSCRLHLVFTTALTKCLFVDGELSAHLAGLHNLKISHPVVH